MAKTKGIYKRVNIYWIRYAGSDGKICFESSKSSSVKVAGKLLIQRKNEVMEGETPVKEIKNYTFRELSVNYLSWARRQRSFKSKEGYIKQLDLTFGNCQLRKINTLFIEEWQTERLAFNKPATVNRHLATLKHMFTKAEEWGFTNEDVIKKIRKVKLLPENNKRLRYLSKNECRALIDACADSSVLHLKPIVITAIHTGMRKEELLSLEWEKHVDLENNLILLGNETKSGKRREIPINRSLKKTLLSLIININSPYVFTDTEGKRFKDVKKSFKSACAKAGIKDFRFHDLRGTCCSHLVMAGVDLVTVKELMGHQSLAMVLRYVGLAPNHKVKAVELLDNALVEKQSIQKVYNLEK
jgi:integrase